MQLNLAFVDQTELPQRPTSPPWDRLDAKAPVEALAILSRLIARMLAAEHPQEDVRND
jgi:hypothetical protein